MKRSNVLAALGLLMTFGASWGCASGSETGAEEPRATQSPVAAKEDDGANTADDDTTIDETEARAIPFATWVGASEQPNFGPFPQPWRR